MAKGSVSLRPFSRTSMKSALSFNLSCSVSFCFKMTPWRSTGKFGKKKSGTSAYPHAVRSRRDGNGTSDESESLPAFRAAASEDRASTAGRHPGSESAFPGSFQSRGLIRSLHDCFPFSGETDSPRLVLSNERFLLRDCKKRVDKIMHEAQFSRHAAIFLLKNNVLLRIFRCTFLRIFGSGSGKFQFRSRQRRGQKFEFDSVGGVP